MNGAFHNEEHTCSESLTLAYTPIIQAREELHRRWCDAALRESIATFLGGEMPPFAADVPRAYLGRHVVSPSFEFDRFMMLSRDAVLEPTVLELLRDKFVSHNPDKYHLAKMYFHAGKGRNGGHRVSALTVIDFESCNGAAFDQIVTRWGESFISFHHRLLGGAYNSYNQFADASVWMRHWGGIETAYVRYLSLFVCFGILFENFPSPESDITPPSSTKLPLCCLRGNGRVIDTCGASFTRDVVLPAIAEVTARFGVKPLIVRLLPPETENDLYWYCYPAALKPIVDASLRGNSFGARVDGPKAVQQINQSDHAARLP